MDSEDIYIFIDIPLPSLFIFTLTNLCNLRNPTPAIVRLRRTQARRAGVDNPACPPTCRAEVLRKEEASAKEGRLMRIFIEAYNFLTCLSSHHQPSSKFCK